MDKQKSRKLFIIVVVVAIVAGGIVTASTMMEDKNQDPVVEDPKNDSENPDSSPERSDDAPPEGSDDPNPIETVDADKEIDLKNNYNKSANVSIEVVREATNETVHSKTYQVDAGERMDSAYAFDNVNITEIESFQITAEYGGQEREMTIKSNLCYGDAFVEVRDNGELYQYYSIC